MRQWVRAPYIDSTIGFVLVIAFSVVFVASGSMILGPNHEIPDQNNLLNLQAQFVTGIHPALLPLYIAGALLTMFGTLYGTLEVACSIAAEMAHALDHRFALARARHIRRIAVVWCAVWAYAILIWLLFYQASGGEDRPRLLLAILTPANLFTGVLACGIFCFLNLWMDRRFLPRSLRMPIWLLLLNLVSGAVFVALGLKGYWDAESGLFAFGSLGVLLVAGCLFATVARGRLGRSHDVS